MKIAVRCKSPLLQKSLEVFLSSYLVTLKQAEIVVCDEKSTGDSRLFYIAKSKDADLLKPFSKSALIQALQERYKEIVPQKVEEDLVEEVYAPSDEKIDFRILEKRIEFLTKEYQQNILKSIKAFYEK